MAVRIICIKKDEGEYENPLLAINYVEWINEKVNVNGITERAQIHDWIKELAGEAYVLDGHGNKVFLVPATTPAGDKYVKTRDHESVDHLLLLPDCV